MTRTKSIEIAPAIWARAKPLGEEMLKVRLRACELFGIPDTPLQDEEDINLLAHQCLRLTRKNPELRARVLEINQLLQALQYTFWSILSEDPQLDLDHNVYTFDTREQKVYWDRIKSPDRGSLH